MDYLAAKYAKLGVDSAPGQEALQQQEPLPAVGDPLLGTPVDFSHGDIDAHPPIPNSLEAFTAGYQLGAPQAYTEYRGKASIRAALAQKLSAFSGCPINPEREIILTPGTQGALFLAMGALVGRGDKVAIVEPDYFANRKLVEFFDGELVPVPLHWDQTNDGAGLDLTALERAFAQGVKLFLYSNPNNPTGVIYTQTEVAAIARLAKAYHVTVLADELYSRQIYDTTHSYTHLCALPDGPENHITIIGPSKTESLSGFRLGVAYGSAHIITRMEKLQAIVSLRPAGYCQSAFAHWFCEPEGWLAQRIADHRAIRDDLLGVIARCPNCVARPTQGGSYLFLQLPPLRVTLGEFVKLCRLQAGVTLTPGTEFGPQFTSHVRLNFSQNHTAAIAAMERVILMIERYRS